jgi:hypothetical protein
MKYSKDEIDEKLKEFLEDFPSMIGEVVNGGLLFPSLAGLKFPTFRYKLYSISH